jgi:hypothetical protein
MANAVRLGGLPLAVRCTRVATIVHVFAAVRDDEEIAADLTKPFPVIVAPPPISVPDEQLAVAVT